MAKINNTQQREINSLLARQAKYENRYTAQIERVLARQYKRVAAQIERSGVNTIIDINPNDYRVILQNIWTNSGTKEAEKSWQSYVYPYLKELPPNRYSDFESKDLFGDIARFLVEGTGATERITVFQSILSDIFTTYTLPSLSGIAETTRTRLQTIIERGIEDGEGADVIARNIRRSANGDINRNRARMIARTEVIGATSRGRILAVLASPLKHSKTWLPTIDQRTRLSHYYMKDYPAIPVEADFQIANSNGMLEPMLCPGDTSRSTPSNYIQCRCSLTFAVLRDENGRVIRK